MSSRKHSRPPHFAPNFFSFISVVAFLLLCQYGLFKYKVEPSKEKDATINIRCCTKHVGITKKFSPEPKSLCMHYLNKINITNFDNKF